ncbi:MAG: hypothetical protein JNM84_12075 [Planctomycetes bacterium]|nr:hypothetical protein [Planctomycetota bacterium]
MASALLTAVPGLRSPLTFLPRSTSRSVPASRNRRRGPTAGDGSGAAQVGTAQVGTDPVGPGLLGSGLLTTVGAQRIAPSATTYRSARPLELEVPRGEASPLRHEAAALAGISSFSFTSRTRGLASEPNATSTGAQNAVLSGASRTEALCGLPHAACTRETFALVLALIVLGLLL